jgi:formate hydrogenlyase subunit 3/multisubunit Na+/H+ antiporter MnhD subunit
LLQAGSQLYGVAIGVKQTNPKTVLAYSSVSQMGFSAAVLGMGLTSGDRGAEMVHFLRRLWPVACLSLLIVAIILGALMLWG